MSGIGRRALLAGLAGNAALASLARRALAQGAPPRRLVLVMQNNGTEQSHFWPGAGFTSPILEPLLSDPALARRTTVVRGVTIPRDANGTTGNEHDIGFARFFTGEKLLSAGGQPWAGGPSIDQLVARAWDTESLTLAVLASKIEPHPKPGFDHRRSFSYVAAGSHRLPTVDPIDVYTRLFPGGDAPGESARRRLARRRSALDAASASLGDLQRRLGPKQRELLDVHLTSVRHLETSLARGLAGSAACGSAPKPPPSYRGTERLTTDESAIPDLVRQMTDLVAASFGCGLARVATLQLGFGGGKWSFGWEGIDDNVHEKLAHADSGDAPDAAVIAKLVRVNRWYATQVATLARRLDAIPEGGGTVLDSTLIVWANEFGRGNHDLSNVPVVLIGGGVPGGRLVDVGPQPFQRVGVTVLRAMGLAADGFGDEPQCGPLRGV